jgi:hypothetical protein
MCHARMGRQPTKPVQVNSLPGLVCRHGANGVDEACRRAGGVTIRESQC